MKGSLLHNSVVSYGKTFCGVDSMSSDSVVYHKLSKRYAHKKGAKNEPPDAWLFACIRGLADYTCEGRDSIEPYSVGVSLVGELTVRELLRLILSPLEKCHVTLNLRRLRGDKSVRSSSAKSVLMRMTALL